MSAEEKRAINPEEAREIKASTMSAEESSRSQTETKSGDLLVAEYTTLRDEITKRIEIQHQLISLALIAPGTVLAIGFQTSNASFLLLYPLLGMFLSAVWLSNSFALLDIGDYIATQIQSRVGENYVFWEHVRISTDTRQVAILHFLGTRGIFIGTELLALFAGITLAKFDTAQTIFLIVGIVSSVLTIAILSLPHIKGHK